MSHARVPLSSVFDNGQEEEEDTAVPGDTKAMTLLVTAAACGERSYAEAQSKVLAQDSNAYAYDEVYDSLHQTSVLASAGPASSSASGGPPKRESRYTGQLLRQSVRREEVLEAARVRKTQREAEADGQPTERFVTREYKEKLDRISRARQEEAERDVLEEAAAASGGRGRGTSAFCAGLLRQVVAEGETVEEGESGNAPPRPVVTRVEQEEEDREAEETDARKRKQRAEEYREVRERRAVEEKKQEQEKRSKMSRRTTDAEVEAARQRYLKRRGVAGRNRE